VVRDPGRSAEGAASRGRRFADLRLRSCPDGVRPYYGELSAYGRWIDLPTYGYAWMPSGVAPGFQPYVNGYWSYGPGGYFWVSYEPWAGHLTTTAVGLLPRDTDGAGSRSGLRGCLGVMVLGTALRRLEPARLLNGPCYTGGRRYGYYDPHCWTFVNSAHLSYRGGYHRHAVRIAMQKLRSRETPW